VQRHHGEAVLVGHVAHDPIGHGHLALVVRQVEARQVGHERVRWQSREHRADVGLETGRIPLGDVVGADGDGDDIGRELGEPRQLVAHGQLNGGPGDTEVDHPQGTPGGQADVVGQDADIAPVR